MTTISVRHLSKAYKKYPGKWQRLCEWLFLKKWPLHEMHWIIRDISFEVKPGEVVGIIGKNGAGKSTLLKLITGTTRATHGEIEIKGRVAALLELGIGFYHEFTGRQNIHMTGQLLGYSAMEIEKNMDAILSFAEIGEYIDQPLRTNSSGMHVRLAFSIATVIRPEVLIIDEALAVGDAYFQQRCIQRIKEFKQSGTTILFVSHDPAAIKTLCDRAILIDKGVIAKEGSPDHVLDYYNALLTAKENRKIYEVVNQEHATESVSRVSVRSGNQKAQITKVALMHSGDSVNIVYIGDRLTLRIYFMVTERIDDLTIGILFKDRLGNEVFGTNTHHLGFRKMYDETEQEYCVDFDFPNFNVGFGHYTLTVALHSNASHVQGNYDWWDQAMMFQMIPREQFPFVGVCFLPTECRMGEV